MTESKTGAQCVRSARWDLYGGWPEPESEAKGHSYRGNPSVTVVQPLLTPIAPSAPSPAERPRFLSEADCQDILRRLERVAEGGGFTAVTIWSSWTGNVRWARNQISTTGEVRNDHIRVFRCLNSAWFAWEIINDSSDDALVAAARRAERGARQMPEAPMSDLIQRYQLEPASTPSLFFEATYQLDAERRAAAARHLAQSAADAGMLSAGYLEVSAHSIAVLDTLGHARYVPYTWAQYSVTVRDPKGTGSGWAGVDWPDWSRIDGAKLSQIALDKCLRSRNSVAIEPGRYTTILEPQAVSVFGSAVTGQPTGSWGTQINAGPHAKVGPFANQTWKAMREEQVVDPRISIWADPMDPDLGFPPFNPLTGADWNTDNMWEYDVYHPVTWIKEGVLKNLSYERAYARGLHQDMGLPHSGAFRMSGGDTSVEEMIATTKRGLLVTRLYDIVELAFKSLLMRGYTRDGLWLIENGRISKPVKNMMFVESALFVLNNVEQLGVPQRIFSPGGYDLQSLPTPAIVPPLKVKDFSFTALVDAV